MKFFLFSSTFIACAFLFSNEPVKAKLLSINGKVQVQHQESGKLSHAIVGDPLHSYQILQVLDGDATIRFTHDKSEVVLREGAEVKIDEIETDDGFFHSIGLMAGSIWAKITKLGNESRYQVITPTMVAAVRGTDFDVSVADDGSTHIGVDHGLVEVSDTEESEKIAISDSESLEADHTSKLSPKQRFLRKGFKHHTWIKEKNKKFKENPQRILKHWAGQAKKWDVRHKRIQAYLNNANQENLQLKKEYFLTKKDGNKKRLLELAARIKKNKIKQKLAYQMQVKNHYQFLAQHRMTKRIISKPEYAHFRQKHSQTLGQLKDGFQKRRNSMSAGFQKAKSQWAESRKGQPGKSKDTTKKIREKIEKTKKSMREKAKKNIQKAPKRKKGF